ncbi:histidine phosphatase family protein [Sphingomonas bacterium]|uniref:histidine phosphatase family protein n=1 Tax=Sphingomonas bacterium TaxID=1895847 RepID=UPI001576F477|nr:histidine phosphatase family protein [Sphingomonas bacterium]
MTATFLLIRHGATDDLDVRLSGRRPGVPLNEAGRAQAGALARRLADERIDAILSSPLDRTRETAEAIARSKAMAVTIDDALIEIDLGEWTGATFAMLHDDRRWHWWNAERVTACCPGGETMAQAQARIVGLLRRLAAERDGETIALVTHSDLIRAALCDVLGLDLAGVHRLQVDPASVSTVVIGDWGGKLLNLNVAAG